MEDGKGDSCPAGILRVTFYKQVFLFNHSQILVHFFTQDSISYMNKNVFLVNKKCSLGEQECSLDDRLGEQNCSLDDPLGEQKCSLGEQKCSLAELLHATFFYKFICKL